jgi:predicted lipoprotein with Yx(FWY)xxD motif
MSRKIFWLSGVASLALLAALAFSAASAGAAAPSADFLKATDTGMSTPQATPMVTEAPGAMSTSAPSGGVLAAPGATVQMAVNATLGDILTDSQGMTLYTFKNDTPGVSNCTGTCAQNWPPLTLTDGAGPVAGTGVSGKLSYIIRPDGAFQVTYDGMPLYRFIGDKQPGDTNGQGLLNGAWSVALVTAAAPAAPAVTAQPSEMQPTATPVPQSTSSSY